MGISCVRYELFFSQVYYIFYNNNYYYIHYNNATVLHSSRSPLPTCFWLKAWAEPPLPQIEAPPQGRAWTFPPVNERRASMTRTPQPIGR